MPKIGLIALLLLLAGCMTAPPVFCGARCADQLREVRWQQYLETPASAPAGAALREIGVLPPLWVRDRWVPVTAFPNRRYPHSESSTPNYPFHLMYPPRLYRIGPHCSGQEMGQ